MATSNFERMLQLVDSVFAVKNDPDQLDVTAEVIEQLLKLHPATASESNDGNGPVAWVLLFPTTEALMKQFIKKEISEKELFLRTEPGSTFDTIYLCSAVVLEEYRRQGITKYLALNAIDKIRETHPIKSLFVWGFSVEGDLSAEKIAQLTNLTLHKRI